MSDFFLYLSLLGVALAVFGAGYGFRMLTERARDQQRRLKQTEQAIEVLKGQVAEWQRRAQPASKHDLRHLERHDIGEATLFDLAEMRESARLLTERIEYASRRALHVAMGGSPDDPPTKWSKP